MSAGKEDLPHIEIERKFLIKRPDEALLSVLPGARRYEIEQIYLPGDENAVERIRRLVSDCGIEYFHTIKRRLTDLSRVEDEQRITEDAYAALKKLAGDNSVRIEKVRWKIPHEDFIFEVDLFPFWRFVAIAEIELETEDARFSFPDYLYVLREVTSEGIYTNQALASALREGNLPEPDSD